MSARRAVQPGVAALILLATLLINLRWSTPQYNWDMLAYSALAHEFNGVDATDLHARTYNGLAGTLTPAKIDELTRSTSYRRAVATDAAAFRQQLPGYRMKPVYPWLISLSTKVGVSPSAASVHISRAAYLIIGFVLLGWLASVVRWPIALGFAWLFMSLPFAIELAELSTPDALSTAIVLAGLCALFLRPRPRLALSVLVIALFVRPDNIAWLLPAAVYVALVQPERRTFAAAAAVLGIGLVILLARWADAPPALALFHHSFIARITDYTSFEPASPATYLRVFLAQSHPANAPNFLLLFAALGSMLWLNTRDRALLLVAGFAVLHWLMYPGEDRLLAPAYFAILVLMVRDLPRAYQSPWSPKPGSDSRMTVGLLLIGLSSLHNAAQCGAHNYGIMRKRAVASGLGRSRSASEAGTLQ